MGRHQHMSIKKAIKSHRVSSKNLQLMCYPKCMHAYQIWIALFFQLNEKQQNYHLNLTFKQNIEIPLLTTDKADHYFLVVISAGSMPIFTIRIKLNLRLELMKK
jgi:hypothetical protein